MVIRADGRFLAVRERNLEPRLGAEVVQGDAARREVVMVPVLALQPGESPRLAGENRTHVAQLAETDAQLPPILVERGSMRVIDGMHRLMAASLRGEEMIAVEFFDGSAADAFLRAVEANVKHGLPLSQADRRAAAARIVVSHPYLSDRAIAELAGLAARRVAIIRRNTAGTVPQLNARVGRDGRVRPLSNAEGRRRAAELIAEHPRASLREVARSAGVSPTTVRDVRQRLERGEDPMPARSGGRRTTGERDLPTPPVAPTFVLEKLLRDPSLRHNENGRRLLRLLQHNAVGAQEWAEVISAIPAHSAPLVLDLACQFAQMWLTVAEELDERVRIIDPQGTRRAKLNERLSVIPGQVREREELPHPWSEGTRRPGGSALGRSTGPSAAVERQFGLVLMGVAACDSESWAGDAEPGAG